MKYCNNCENQLDDDVRFCPVCGNKQPIHDEINSVEENTSKKEPDKNKNYNKERKILIAVIVGVILIIILVAVIGVIFLRKDKSSNSESTTTEAVTTEETTTEKPTTEEPTTEDEKELENIAAKEAYYSMISGLVTDAVYYSSDYISVADENDSSQYVVYYDYSIEDFDSDGVSELMIYSGANESPNGDSVSYGTGFDFYEYNAETDSVTFIHDVCGEFDADDDSTIFYGNGVIEFTSDERSTDDGGEFICVNTDIFDIMGCDDYEERIGYEMYEEPDMFLISIVRENDGTYYMYFISAFSIDYMFELSEDEAKEYLDNLRDAGTIDAEINDFDLEELADVCGFDYDEAVAEIEAKTPAVDYEAMYGEVLEKYIQFINDGADYSQVREAEFPYQADDGCYDEYNIGIVDPLGEIGYLISDLDGNGIPELLIGICDDSFVLDVYTIRNDEIVLILNSGERSQLYYCGDSIFYWSGSSGAASSEIGLYKIDSGYATVLEVIYTEPEDEFDGNSETLFYYSTISAYEPENATIISADEFQEKSNEFSGKICSITGLIPLSEY